MSYDKLRTLSFCLKEDVQLQKTFYTLNFPGRSELLQLQAELSERPIDRVSIPISLLNKAIRALVPDIIYISRNAGRSNSNIDENYAWLYSETPVNPQALYLIIHAWVQTQFSRASDERRRQILQHLQPQQLIWQQIEVNTAKWTIGENGTANLGNEDQFILLPHILAAKFSKPDISLQFGSETLRFRRAPMPPGTKGAEIISWKPLEYNGWYWSVVITFTVQTLPFQNYPVIHTDISVRRWASRAIIDLPVDKETSIYLLTSVPWLEGLNNSESFQVAPIARRRLPASQLQPNQPQYEWTWGSNLTALLNRLNRYNPFPVPQDIINSPLSTLNLTGTPNAALVYRNAIKPAHDVEPGFGPADRRQLAEQIEGKLASEWKFVEAPKRFKYGRKLPKNCFQPDSQLKKTTSINQLQLQRCQSINKTVGNYLTVEIWYQSLSTRDTIVSEIRQFLGISELESFPYTFASLGFTLNIQEYELGSLGDALQLDSNITNRIEQRRQAISRRSQELESRVEKASSVTVAFIELHGAEKFPNNADPKDALRQGFALTDRLTQFISTENTGNLSNRAINGFLDLLRQLGVQAQPPKIVIKIPVKTQDNSKKALPEQINYVGVWLIKQNAPTSADGSIVRVPVMVHMASHTTEIKAIAPGIGREWLPYREALLKIAKGEVQGYQRTEEAVARFIKPKLDDVLSLGDTLLLCHAQNIRSAWKYFSNTNITKDKFSFVREKLLEIEDFNPNLRIVRMRDSRGYETPEWYAPNENEQGFTEGIFTMGERVFASTSNKPKQFKNLSKNLSKVTTSETNRGNELKASPHKYFWNPGLVELTVACIQPNEDPGVWAAIAHELRRLALHYDDALKLPLPLHLAKLMEDYVLLLSDELSEEIE